MSKLWGYLKSNTEGFDDIPLTKDFHLFGRNRPKTLSKVIYISNLHFEIKKIYYSNSEWIIIRDNSTNGTYVNGEPCGSNTRLFCYDEINLLSPSSKNTVSFTFIENRIVEEDIINGGIQNEYEIGKFKGGSEYFVRREITNKKTNERFTARIIRICQNPIFNYYKSKIDFQKKFDSPLVVKILEPISTPQHLFYISELVEEGSLYDYLFKEIFTKKQVRFIVNQIVKGLEYLSSMKIIHRGIRPEHILFANRKKCQIKLSDCIVSGRIDDLDYKLMCYGKNYFVAPEILNEKLEMVLSFNPKAEIWSVGMMFYMLAYDQPPMFWGYYPTPLSLTASFTDIKNLFGRYPEYKSLQDDLITQMIEIDFENRPTPSQVLNHPYFKYPLESSY